jgi:tyrosine-protein phosphatase SIW14
VTSSSLTPSFRVAHGVYRSSYPTKKTLPFLKHIGVRSIVYLCLEEYTDGAKKFLEENDIRLFPHGTPGREQQRLSRLSMRSFDGA